MADPFDDNALRSLLWEADRILDLLRTQDNPKELDASMASLDVVYRDVGRSLHDMWQLHSSAQAEPMELEIGIEDLDEAPTPVANTALDDGLWVDSLQDLLALLEPPPVEESPAIVAVEAARVQWASVELGDRWASFPEPIQLALLGMLSARCRWLAARLSCQAGPVTALSRLAAYRRVAGLATVVGLMLDHEPEYDSWTDDAISWWGMLTAGFQTA